MASATGTINTPKIKVYSQTGPASYSTGGFVITGLTSDFSWIGHIEVAITTRGTLPAVNYEIFKNVNASNAESLGNGGIRILRGMYDRATLNAITGLPGGVTAQSSKFAAGTTTGSDHTHANDHDHGNVDSADNNSSGTGVTTNVGEPAADNHNHTFTIPAYTGSTGSSTHSHDRSFEYQHNHAVNTPTTTNVTITEVASTTNLSGVTFNFIVYGFGKE